jgi:hypothetical protein
MGSLEVIRKLRYVECILGEGEGSMIFDFAGGVDKGRCDLTHRMAAF